MSMPLHEAVAEAQKMKNVFSAFESLENVLKSAQQADQVARERARQAEGLHNEIIILAETHAKALQEHNATLTEIANEQRALRANFEREMTERRQKANTEHDAAIAANALELAAFQQQISAARDEAERLSRERDGIAASIRALREELAAIKARLE
jgi:chromosome segregation ATPase